MTDSLDPRDSASEPPVGGALLPPAALPPEEFPPLGPPHIRFIWRALIYVAIFVALIGVIELFLTFVGVRIAAEPTGPGVLLAQEILATVCAILAALAMGRLEGRRFEEFGMPLRQAFRGSFWKGLVWGLVTVSALMLLIRALGGYSFGELALRGSGLWVHALKWAAVFLLVGIYEEFFFRGYLQYTLASGIRFWPAALITSAIFGAAHLRNPGEGIVGALSVFLTGIFLCLTLQRTGALWFAIGWHAAYDFGETYIYSVPNSGIVLPGHLLASSFHGPKWLTGGTIGPEGSVFDFVLLALSILVFDRVYPRRSEPGVASAAGSTPPAREETSSFPPETSTPPL